MKAFLRILMYLLIVLVLLVGALVVIIMTLDLNRFKPTIQKVVTEYGATLEMPGDIQWKLFPSIGLELGEMTLRSVETGETLTTIKAAAFSVQFKPLLSGQILVDGIELAGLQASYKIDEQGLSNWQPILDALAAQEGQKSAPQAEDSAPAESGPTPELEIKTFKVTELALEYANAQDGSMANIHNVNLHGDHLSLTGVPFSLSVAANLDYANYPPIALTWEGALGVDLDKQTAFIRNSQGAINTAQQQLAFTLSNNTVWAPKLTVEGEFLAETKALKTLLQALEIELPPTQDPSVIQPFSLDIGYSLDDNSIQLEPIRIKLDQTHINGLLEVNNFAAPAITAALEGDEIDLDRYLTPITEESAGEEPVTPPSGAQPLPFELLRSLNLDIKLAFEEVIANKLAVTAPTIKIKAQKGMITLQELSAGVADGQILGQGIFDARNNPARLDLNIDVQKLNVHTLAITFAEMDNFSGALNAQLSATSFGTTDQDLSNNLVAHAKASSASLKMEPINIEHQFCQAVALLQQEPLPQHDWPKQTLFAPLNFHAQYANKRATVETATAKVANLKLGANGHITPDTGKFDFDLRLSLGNFAGDIPGCTKIRDNWRKRDLPIRCKGNVEAIGAKTCLPDEDVIKDLLEEKAKRKLREEGRRTEDKAKDEVRDLLEKELGKDKAKEAEDTLRGLFKQLKGK